MKMSILRQACDDAAGVIKGTRRRIESECGFDAVCLTNLFNVADQANRDIHQANRHLIV